MNREPVNLDDPQLTAYALGEMTSAERAEFEAQLEASPIAQRELESMEDMMSLLSRGLKEEWCAEMKQPSLEVLPAAEISNVVPVQFRQSRKAMAAIAAGIAAMVLVGGAVVSNRGTGELAQNAGMELNSPLVASVGEMALVSNVNGVHVPELFLTEEVQGSGSVDLVQALANLDNMTTPVDATYLEADSVVSGSRAATASSGVVIPAGFSRASATERIDSYLPPVNGTPARHEAKQGLIEGRMNALAAPDSPIRKNDGSVFVRGYVAMDSGSPQGNANRGGRVLAGFRPVSIIGNPVLNTEVDLQLISDFQSIQNEFSTLLKSLPQDADARKDLERLVERNRKAVSDLKREFSQ